MKFLLLFASLFLFSCQRSPTLSQVGAYSITQKDVDYREQILRLSYPQYSGDLKKAALNQLVQSLTFAEILKNNGQSITDETLKKEADRIDKTTLMPEALGRIKKIFDGDQTSYYKDYILPVYSERVIYFEFFLHDKKVQAESLEKVESFLRSVLSSHQASQVYRGHEVIRFTVSLARGIEWEEDKKSRRHSTPSSTATAETPKEIQDKFDQNQKAQVSEEGKRWISEIILKLKPGETHSKVIDQQSQWWVVRYMRKKPKFHDTYEMEAAVFPKADYEKWLKAEKDRVVIREP